MPDSEVKPKRQMPRGKPFVKGDPRICRDPSLLSRRKRAINNFRLRVQKFLEARAKAKIDGEDVRVPRLDAILTTAFRRAVAGDAQWAKILFEYAYGKPAQDVNVSLDTVEVNIPMLLQARIMRGER